jgi:aspartate aminotransferase-like enzyme/GNAT superfamily N-acetyltransferase
MTGGLTFKIASEPSEFEQIHSLNYRTFVEEIPQHELNPDRLLVDRFHNENTYYICLDGERLVGMLAVRTKRPFSLDTKLENLDSMLPPGASVCELRLLAVEPEYRKTSLFAQLFRFVASRCIGEGCTLAVASGTLRQTRLYRRMGFVPFGPLVGSEEAPYHPMYLSLVSALALFDRLKIARPAELPVSFLPGPVETSPAVVEAFRAPSISHRSREFVRMMDQTRSLLSRLTGARFTAVLVGTGTLANDVVAAHLRLIAGSGVVLTNGEFGDRLADHAERMQLSFETVHQPWGSRFEPSGVEALLDRRPDVAWLWITHCETSTGRLADLREFSRICETRGIRLVLDCTSSFGSVPLDLSKVFLATSVSGKAVGAPAGLALVFYNESRAPDRRLPRSLDLGYYEKFAGVPFTHSSPLLAALRQALGELSPAARWDTARRQKLLITQRLQMSGLQPAPAEDDSSPAIINVPIPGQLSSRVVGEAVERAGFLIGYRSRYLLERNLVQICLMGRVDDSKCHALAATLAAAVTDYASGEPRRSPRREPSVAAHEQI